jgi:hypothetical protein
VLFHRQHLDGIVAGRITLAFRMWVRPTVRAGGRLRTAAGVLGIDAVDRIDPSELTDDDARAAGFDALVDLHREIDRDRGGSLYRIRVRYAGPDERASLREQTSLTDGEWARIRKVVAGLDASGPSGPWVVALLRIIAARPGRRSDHLARDLGLDRAWLKTRIRKLKELGITESLEVGYRISPRGQVVLDSLGAGS